MVNKVAKGKRIEREFEKILQNNGFETYKPNWSRFGKKDIWLFDILAIKNSYPILFIQVKSNINDYYKARKQLKEWIKDKNDIEANFFVVCRLKKMNGEFSQFTKIKNLTTQ